MAPLRTRQSHSLGPGIPRHPKRPPNTPVKVEKSIDPRVFGELLAGTVAIFVIGVLFWKLGQFIRRFNRDKVLRPGKSTHTRYARTWYGWVTRSTHERNKKIVHGLCARIRDSLAWKSNRDDYSWIWWDPGDVKRRKHRQQPKGLCWLPACFRSYDDFPTADELWNPCSIPKCHGALNNNIPTSQASPISDTMQWPQVQEGTRGTIPPQPSTLIKNPPLVRHFSPEEIFRGPSQPKGGGLGHQPQNNFDVVMRMPTTCLPKPFHQFQSLPCRQNRTHGMRESTPWSRNGSFQPISCRGQSAIQRDEVQCKTQQHISLIHTKEVGKFKSNGHSRKYRGWSARMQMEPKGAAPDKIGDSSGPPGTPRTDLLASCISDSSSSFHGHFEGQRNSTKGRLRILGDRTPVASRVRMGNQVLFSNECRTYTRTVQWYSAPVRGRLQGNQTVSTPRPGLYNEWRSLYDSHQNAPVQHQDKHPKTDAARYSADHIQPKTSDGNVLTDWELKMLERLDRKLRWLFDEFTPGQKPYHFTLLANHWLNRETWLVYDPISRVPTDARREWGDPRFNVPYPPPMLSPRSKYPVSSRTRAQSPRIDSWRAAVNNQRRISGIHDVIRTITLYEESAEEPPDGHIDPGCWALPKPPQGFEMSTAQRNAWYEGGAGWQEKLEDWQNVHRGYRIQKAIHEGRVNRDRLKEVAAQVHKCCRSASGKFIPSYDLMQQRASNFLVP